MKCRKFERLILRSFDHELNEQEKEEIALHLSDCGQCRQMKSEYDGILSTLRSTSFPEVKPFFEQRLLARLGKESLLPVLSWQKVAVRAASTLVLAAALLVGGLSLYKSEPLTAVQQELSESEILLLQNLNPFQEARAVMEAENAENKNMMLIFTYLGEQTGVRRYFP